MLKVAQERGGTGRKWLPIGGLVLLSLLWAVGWVRADLSPGSGAGLRLSPVWSEAVLLGLFAVPAAVVGAVLKKDWPGRIDSTKALLTGFGLFVVPAIVGVLVQEGIDEATRVALFSLTPLFAVTFQPHFGMGADQAREIRGGFPAAMVAVAGSFLVFPFELPRTYAAAGSLLAVIAAAASVAAANCVGVGIVREQDICPLTFGVVSTGSAAMMLGLAGLIHGQHGNSPVVLNVSVVSDVLALALLFWLMRQMSAVQMTTRFLIAPLMANLIGLALLRPHVEVQAWIGLLLITGGAGWMLFAPPTGASNLTTLNAR